MKNFALTFFIAQILLILDLNFSKKVLKKLKKTDIQEKTKEIIHIDSTEDFNTKVKNPNSNSFVYFFGNDCKLCKDLSKIMIEHNQNHKNVKVFYVNIDDLPDIAKEFDIKQTPILSYFKHGVMLESKTIKK